MPIDSRVTPDAASSAADASVTVSGFASTVTSASGSMPKAARTPSSMRARSPGGSRVGVPPPKNTVVAARSGPASASTPRARSDFPQERVGVLVLPRAAQLARGVGVEVAVSAPHPAEGDVEVDPELRIAVDRDRQRPVAGCRLAERER